MSDFLFSSTPRPEGQLGTTLRAYLDPVTDAVREVHGAWGSLAVASCSHDPQVLQEDPGGLTVLLGWPVLHGIGALPPAPVLDEARRRETHRLLVRSCSGAIARLDGPFAALSIDRGGRRATVITDRMSFIPVFFAADDRDRGPVVVLGSHVDAVADAAGRRHDVDPVSAADFVAHSTITYPLTLYRGVEQFPPAAERTWGRGGWEAEARVYWLPEEPSPTRYRGRAARTLRARFAAAVAYGCEGRDRVGLQISGGEDSRSVLGAIPAGVQVEAFIYGDWQNREYRIARRVAEVYGARLHFGRRTPDHYLHHDVLGPIVGTQHRYTDIHSWGLHREMGLDGLPIVLGGYFSDSLLKANYAHPPKKRLIRRASPLPGERSPPTIMNTPGIRETLLREVEARRDAHRRRVAAIRPRSADEWLVLWPFSMRAGSANIHGSRRLFRAYEPFLSNGILDIAAAVPQLWKREHLLFHRAMRPFLAPSWYIPHGRSRYPFFGPVANVPLGLGIKVARAVRDRLVGESDRPQGPWPELSDLVRTPDMTRRRESLAIKESPVADILERNLSPAQLLAAQRSWTPEQQLGLLQLVAMTRRP